MQAWRPPSPSTELFLEEEGGSGLGFVPARPEEVVVVQHRWANAKVGKKDAASHHPDTSNNSQLRHLQALLMDEEIGGTGVNWVCMDFSSLPQSPDVRKGAIGVVQDHAKRKKAGEDTINLDEAGSHSGGSGSEYLDGLYGWNFITGFASNFWSLAPESSFVPEMETRAWIRLEDLMVLAAVMKDQATAKTEDDQATTEADHAVQRAEHEAPKKRRRILSFYNAGFSTVVPWQYKYDDDIPTTATTADVRVVRNPLRGKLTDGRDWPVLTHLTEEVMAELNRSTGGSGLEGAFDLGRS